MDKRHEQIFHTRKIYKQLKSFLKIQPNKYKF